MRDAFLAMYENMKRAHDRVLELPCMRQYAKYSFEGWMVVTLIRQKMGMKSRPFREEQKKRKQAELSQDVVVDSQQSYDELPNVSLRENESVPKSRATSRYISTILPAELTPRIAASRTKFADTNGPVSTLNNRNAHVEDVLQITSNAAATVPDLPLISSNLDPIGLDLSSTRAKKVNDVNEVNNGFQNDEDDENNVDIRQSEFQVRTVRGGIRHIQDGHRESTSQTYEEIYGQDEIERIDAGRNVHSQQTRDAEIASLQRRIDDLQQGIKTSEGGNKRTHKIMNITENRRVQREGTENELVRKRQRKIRNEKKVKFGERTASHRPASRGGGPSSNRSPGAVALMRKRSGAGSSNQGV